MKILMRSLLSTVYCHLPLVTHLHPPGETPPLQSGDHQPGGGLRGPGLHLLLLQAIVVGQGQASPHQLWVTDIQRSYSESWIPSPRSLTVNFVCLLQILPCINKLDFSSWESCFKGIIKLDPNVVGLLDVRLVRKIDLCIGVTSDISHALLFNGALCLEFFVTHFIRTEINIISISTDFYF